MTKIIYVKAIIWSIFLAIILEIMERIFSWEHLTQVFDFDNTWNEVILTVIIGPFFETLIFQVGLILGLRILFALILDNQDTKSNPVLIPSIVISAVIFGGLHYYNLLYIIVSIFLGLYFGYIYYLAIKKDIKPLFPVFIAHAVYNLFVFILDSKIFGG